MFTLGLQNLQNIHFDQYEKDFVFLVNGKRYETSRFVADLLSPIIRKLHYTDQTQNEFCIESKHHLGEDYFEEFLKFVNFEPKTIESSQICIYSEYFNALGNIDEYVKLQQVMIEEFTLDNIFAQLQAISQIISKENQSESVTEIFKEMIEFCSENFEELDKDKLKELDSFIVEEILANPKLRVNKEETVLNFVLKMYEKQSCLFQYVLVQNLSLEGLRAFIDAIQLSDINIKTWHNICERLFSEHEDTNERYIKQEQNGNIKTFECSQDKETFNGIMKYLTNQTGRNIHNNGTIKITSNSINTSNQNPQNSVDFDNSESNYCSKDLSDSHICFDFKNRSVQLSNYAIKSRTKGSSSDYTSLKSWVIEASNDNTNWIELDRRDNDKSLNGRGFTKTFTVKNPQAAFYRFIRLRQTGKSWYGGDDKSYHFGLTFIEFYGKLQEPAKK